jgi:hypothetical protein
MSLDGFIAGPGDAMDWIFDFVAPDAFPEIAAQPCRKRQAEVPAQAPAAAAGGPCRAIELQP